MQCDAAESRRFDEDKSLVYYYREVDRYPQLTPQEEQDLAVRIKAGDAQALEKLVQANLRFVIHVARGFQNQGLSLGDLINEGNLGLVTAARKFDLQKGCRFITYAVWWIRQNILKALEIQTRAIRVPANVLNDLSRLRKAEAGLAQNLNRTPTSEELASETDFRDKKFAYTLDAAANTVSLDTPCYQEGETCLVESIPDPHTPPPDESFVQQAMRRDVRAAVGLLPERSRQILSLYFGMDGDEPATYQQIGNQLGVSRERVRQLKEDALSKLRRPALSRRLAAHCE